MAAAIHDYQHIFLKTSTLPKCSSKPTYAIIWAVHNLFIPDTVRNPQKICSPQINKLHANLTAKTRKRTDSIQIQHPRTNLVSDIVSGIKKSLQSILQSSSSPSLIQSLNSEFPSEISFAPPPSTIWFSTSKFPNESLQQCKQELSRLIFIQQQLTFAPILATTINEYITSKIK